MTDSSIQIIHKQQPQYTVLPNDFIDGPMCRADGEYVKIYLMILRLSAAGLPVTCDSLADRLNLTQKDIVRAVSYWEKAGLLFAGPAEGTAVPAVRPDQPRETQEARPARESQDLQESQDFRDSRDSTDSGRSFYVPEKKVLSPLEIESSRERSDFSRTIFMAETYLGRLFSHSELNSLVYISDQLHFSPELIEYLIEYCVEKGRKNIRYIERVAINWYQKGISTVAQAREESSRYGRLVFPVMKALGISNRNPGPAELEYIDKWKAMDLSEELILEACNRTILSIHQPSFQYADSILSGWQKNGVRTMEDVACLDRKHEERTKNAKDPARSPSRDSRKNSFHNFEQRTYNFDDLESRLLGSGRRQ